MENQKTTRFNLERLKEIAKPSPPKSIMLREERARNRGVYELSSRIALFLRWLMRERNIDKADLAKILNLSPAICESCLSGKRNFTLKEIANLENKLNIKILKKFEDLF